MTGALPLEAAISLDNLRAGREEWFNVQDPVRNALELIFAHLQDNGQSLRRLDASTMAFEKTGQAVESLKQEVRGLAEADESHEARLRRVEGRLDELGDELGQSVRGIQENLKHEVRGIREGLKQEMRTLVEEQDAKDARLKRVEGRLEELGDGLGQGLKQEVRGVREGLGAEVAGLRRQLEGRLSEVGAQLEEVDSRLRRQAELGGALEEGLAGAAAVVDGLRRRVDEGLPAVGGGKALGKAEAERMMREGNNDEGLEELRRRMAKELGVAEGQRQRLEERLEAAVADLRDNAAQAEHRIGGSLASLVEELRQAASLPQEEEKRAKAAERRLEGLCAELQAAVAEAKAEAAAAGNAREADRKEGERRVVELRSRVEELERGKGDKEGERRAAELRSRVEELERGKGDKEGERRVAELRSRVEELERGKVDRAAMQKFTGDVLDAFDNATVETERKLESKWVSELQGLRAETDARLQGLASAQELQRVASELEGLMEALGQIRIGVEQMQRDAQSQAPPCTREEVRLIASELLRQRDANGDREELRAAVQRANEAATAAMAAVEVEADALEALKERVNAMQPKVNSVHEALYGSSPNSAMSPQTSPLRNLLGGSRGRSSAPPALSPRQKAAVGALKRLEAAEEQLQNLMSSELPAVTSELATKADKVALEAVARQADTNAASIEELSNETVARAEDVAKSISALSRGLNAHLQDRLTHSIVQSMIDEAAAAIDEETVRKIRAMMDHTHVVEQAERVLVQEDGTPVVIDSGPLRGVKLSAEGGEGGMRASAELWERVSRLDAVLEAVQMRLEEQEGRSRRQPPSPSPNTSPEVQAAAAFAGSIKRRVDLLEAAREATEHKLNAVSHSVQVVAKKAESAAAVGASNGASGKEQEEMRWEVLMDRLSTVLDEKASHEEVRRALDQLEERLEPRIDGGRQGLAQVGNKAQLDSFGVTDELEARLRSLISTKADKEAVEEMFSSCRKAIDARPSRAEVQAALKEKLDTRAFIAGSRQSGGGGSGAAASLTPRMQFGTTGALASAASAPHQPRSGYSGASVVHQSQSAYSSSTSARAALEEQARTLF